jgi:hypothetical protein
MRSVKILALLAIAALVAALLVFGCTAPEPVPGDETFDPLAASGPSESVARVAALAGYEGAIVGNSRAGAVARLTLPSIESAADVELAWQTGLAALAAAYPQAGDYIVQVVTDRELLEVRIDGRAGREAVENNDADAVRAEAEFTYLGGQTSASDLPGDSYDSDSGEIMRYLDAKNRATGLLGDEGPEGPESAEITAVVAAARAAVPGVSAPEPGQDAGSLWAARSASQLASSVNEGAADLAERLGVALTGMESDEVQEVKEWFHVVSAVESDGSYGTVLGPVSSTAENVLSGEVPDGPEADAVLVAIDDSTAPRSAKAVEVFERVESDDTSGTGEGELLPDVVIASNGGESAVIAYLDGPGFETVDTDAWLAYERADGTRYWLAGADGAVALTDGSVRGWAFSREQAALVSATNVGVWREVFPTQ